MRLKGKTALVTGGSRGIGRAIAEAFAREGADVAVNYVNNAKAAEEVVQAVRALGRKAIAVQADVGKYEDGNRMADQVIKEFGRVDILVNNAGFCQFMPFLDITREVWENTFDVDVRGTFYTSQLIARHMVENKVEGRIINITSIGAFRSNPTQTHYCAAKGGQEILTKGMALELAPYKITVNSLAPGTIHTDINRDFFKQEGAWDRYNLMVPLGIGKPEDCASAAVFFAADDASYITGTCLLVDGGMDAQLLP